MGFSHFATDHWTMLMPLRHLPDQCQGSLKYRERGLTDALRINGSTNGLSHFD